MSLITKQLLINKLTINLPKELIDIVKDYTFHKIKKIPKNDVRYPILLTIPPKEYDYTDDTTYVYLSITGQKDYFITYRPFKIQIQTFRYGDGDDNTVYFVDGATFVIE